MISRPLHYHRRSYLVSSQSHSSVCLESRRFQATLVSNRKSSKQRSFLPSTSNLSSGRSSVSAQNNSNNSTNNNGATHGVPWHQALRAFRHQLFAGQELTSDLAQRVTTIFERQGDAADLLRWWILFRCENVPPTVSEARALLYHNMWKQALYTSVIATTPPGVYSEFGQHAAIATCRSGNWRLALQLCQRWEVSNDLQQSDSEQNENESSMVIPSNSFSPSPSAFLAAASMRNVNKAQQQQQHGSTSRTSSSSSVTTNGIMVNVPSWAVALNAMFVSARQRQAKNEKSGGDE